MIGNKVGASRGPAGQWLVDTRPATVRTQVEDALVDMRTEASPLTDLRLWAASKGGSRGRKRRQPQHHVGEPSAPRGRADSDLQLDFVGFQAR